MYGIVCLVGYDYCKLGKIVVCYHVLRVSDKN